MNLRNTLLHGRIPRSTEFLRTTGLGSKALPVGGFTGTEANSSPEIVVSFCWFKFAFFSQHSRRNIVVTLNPIHSFSRGI